MALLDAHLHGRAAARIVHVLGEQRARAALVGARRAPLPDVEENDPARALLVLVTQHVAVTLVQLANLGGLERHGPKVAHAEGLELALAVVVDLRLCRPARRAQQRRRERLRRELGGAAGDARAGRAVGAKRERSGRGEVVGKLVLEAHRLRALRDLCDPRARRARPEVRVSDGERGLALGGRRIAAEPDEALGAAVEDKDIGRVEQRLGRQRPRERHRRGRHRARRV